MDGTGRRTHRSDARRVASLARLASSELTSKAVGASTAQSPGTTRHDTRDPAPIASKGVSGAVRVFDQRERTDKSIGRHGESMFEFLDRTGTAYFGAARDLVEGWFARVPVGHQPALRGALRSSTEQFSAAFWELYLHEAYRRSGYEIEIHPPLSGSARRPDFLLSRGDERFYLEAVSVGRDPRELAADARLAQVHRVLAEMLIRDFYLGVEVYEIGERPLRTGPLRGRIRRWLDGVDHEEARRALASDSYVPLPAMAWNDGGWALVVEALPAMRGGEPHPALGMTGSGEAVAVDNVTGIRRVLDQKRRRYGAMDAPLIIAVMASTEFPTNDEHSERALYGLSSARPPQAGGVDDRLYSEGLWVERGGWRNGHVPQVITAYGLAPWAVPTTVPRLWSTYEPGIRLPDQPQWLARVDSAGNHPVLTDAPDLASHFDLPEPWPAGGPPDFDGP